MFGMSRPLETNRVRMHSSKLPALQQFAHHLSLPVSTPEPRGSLRTGRRFVRNCASACAVAYGAAVDEAASLPIISHAKHRLLEPRLPSAIPSELKPEVDQILEAILYLYTESRRITKNLARSVDLTGPQLTVLKMLEGVGDLSLSQLSERIRAQNSTVTGIIDRMEREGLVVRARCTEDRRVVRIRLTDKGSKIAHAIEVEPMEIFRSALEGLSGGETRDLLTLLTKIARRVQSIATKE